MTLNYKYLALFLLFSIGSFAQVGIGTPTPQGALDVESTNSGVVVPRVALTSKNDVTTIINPQGGNVVNGTLIWNTATAGAAPNNVVPGFYYYTHPTWTPLGGDTTRQWSLSGNAGTIPGTDYLGTTDAVDLRIKTNNLDRFTFSNNGSLRSHYLGAAATPAYSFNGDPNTGIFSPGADQLGFSTNNIERLRIPNTNQVHAMNLGSVTAPFYSFSADTNTGMYSTGADALAFSTNGVQRMRLLNNGQVVINNTGAPSASDQLSVNSTISAINGYSTGVNGIGVYGQATGTSGGVGVYGITTGTASIGQFGSTNSGTGFGVRGRNTSSNGTGIIGSGNNYVGTYLTDGSGGAFSGTTTGLFAYTTTTGVGSGIVIQDIYNEQWDVGAWDGLYYKIIGTGTVSTVVKGLNNENVVMQCTETPEGLFEDYGIGQLVNGKAHITIDPIFSKNIKVSDEFPMKVFVQLEGECNGVFVTNKSANSFDVIELQGGTSNVKFSYSIVANRADETFTTSSGETRNAVYSNRFNKAPKFRETEQWTETEIKKEN